MPQRGRGIVERGVDLAAQQIVDRRRAAAIGHVRELHARHRLEQFRRQMGACAVARIGHGNASRVARRVLRHFLDRAVRTIGVDHQHVGQRDHGVHGREVLRRIEAEGLVEVLVGGLGSLRSHQKGVAVGPGLGDVLGGRIAARARPVLDHHRLAQALRDLAADQAADLVGDASRGAGRNNGHRASRIGVGMRGRDGRRTPQRQQQRNPSQTRSRPAAAILNVHGCLLPGQKICWN